MKTFPFTSAIFAAVSFFLGLSSHAAPTVPGGGPPGTVIYSPAVNVVQGNQPLLKSYQLSITSPSNLPSGVTAPLTVLVDEVLTKPEAVDEGMARSFVSFSPSTLAFTGPNQVLSVMVTVDVPEGNFAGDYSYRIKHSGWPNGLPVTDEGATVNALVEPAASTDISTPTVVLQTPADGTEYVYYPATGVPVTVPITFAATVNETGEPINGLLAYLNNGPVTGVTTTGIGSHNATGAVDLALTEPGTYEIRVTASNQHGTSEDRGVFTVVVSAPPPTISVTSPAPETNYIFAAGGTGVSVPVSYTATSVYGNITATGATLNGSPIDLNLSGVNTSLVAAGSTTLNITTPGSYVLNFTAANAYGLAVPVTVPFTVSSYEPLPTVTIVTPEDGAVITRTQGDPATAVSFSFTGSTDFGLVESVTVVLDGETVVATVDGVGTASSITGSFTQSFTTAGTHTLTVTLDNGFSTATDSATFTIKELSGEICANLTWLPPISLNKTVQGGSVMPIKFTLRCQGEFVRNESVLISIYEILPDGTMTDPVLYPYGTGSPNPAEYAITGPMYHLNYPTAEGVHRYRIEVWLPLSADGSNLQLLGTKDLLTKGDDKDCKSDKSNKSGKSNKSDKSSKSDKYGYGNPGNHKPVGGAGEQPDGRDNWGSGDKGKSDSKDYGKSDKSNKGGQSNKSDKGSKSDKSGYGNPGNHKSVGGAGEQPDGRDNWGSGDKGKSDGKSDKGKTSSKYPSKR